MATYSDDTFSERPAPKKSRPSGGVQARAPGDKTPDWKDYKTELKQSKVKATTFGTLFRKVALPYTGTIKVLLVLEDDGEQQEVRCSYLVLST